MRPNRIVPLVIVALVAAAAPALAAGTTVRVSVGAGGQQGNSVSFSPSLSGDGRYVAFQSVASNLVANDSNGAGLDVFVRDRQAGTTTLASVRVGDTSGDREADLDGTFISRSGRYVVFGSNATDLVPNDTNGDYDVFVRDLVARTTRLVSVGSAGQQSDSFSYPMAISATGQFVVFASSATNLVAGVPDTILLYVRDLKTGKTTLESRRPDGRPSAGLAYGGASITPDGHYLAFAFEGSDLVTGHLLSDTNIFLRDRWTGRTVLVSAAPDGTPANDRSFDPFISDNGRLVAFNSSASNLVPNDTNFQGDVFVRDVASGTVDLVSVARNGQPPRGDLGGSTALGMTPDGRRVLFASGAPDLVPGDTNFAFDTFVRDRVARVTTRVDVKASGGQSNRGSYGDGAISTDGSIVAFSSNGDHLVPGDTNGDTDVFVRVSTASR